MQHRLLISTCIFKRTSQYMHFYHWRATVTPCKPGSPLFLPPPWRNVMQWFPNPLTLAPCLPPPSPLPPSASARFEVISYSSLSSCSFKTCSTHSLHVAASVKFPRVPCSFGSHALQISNTVPAEMLGKAPTVLITLLCPVFITWTPKERGYGYSSPPSLCTHSSSSLAVLFFPLTHWAQ